MYTLNLGGYGATKSEPEATNEIKYRGFVSNVFWEDGNHKFGFRFRLTGRAKIPTRSGLKQRKEFSVFATMQDCLEDSYLEISGHWSPIGEKYDEASFNAKSCVIVDDDVEGATSMMKFCFGPVTSSRIIGDGFDDDAMEAWACFRDDEESFLERIADVKGVGRKKVESAHKKYEDHMAMEVLYRDFKKYGLSLTQSSKIYDKFGTRIKESMEKNPYCISKYAGFTVTDRIALKHYKVEKTNSKRIDAAIMATLAAQEQDGGHVFMRLDEPVGHVKTLKQAVCRILQGRDKELFPEALIVDELINLEKKKKVVLDKQKDAIIVYLPKFYHAEVNLAKHLKTRVSSNGIDDSEIDNYIDAYQKQKELDLGIDKFELADLQCQAIHTAIKNQFCIISGPPGSGKTTIIDCIVTILKELNPDVDIALCAPTGKAAKRMTESTGMPASTVHRLLQYDPETKDFSYNASNPLPYDVVIADECSMMGLCLCDSLIAAVSDRAKVIFVGDKDQLPSVDAGKVLADLLQVDYIPKVILNKVYRQKEGSTILQRALVLAGADGNPRVPDLSDAQDFKFYNYSDPAVIMEGSARLYEQEVKRCGIDNVLFLIPQNKGDMGVNAMNNILQGRINPDPEGKKPFVKIGKDKIFREGDRVIQLVNEDEYEVFNGMIGTITRIFKDSDTNRDVITVDFGDDHKPVDYERDRFENIKLAYAMTIHKCQGSEAKSVIMLLVPQHYYMITQKLVYTGWTRSKEILHIVGSPQMMNVALRPEPPRLSKLVERLTV